MCTGSLECINMDLVGGVDKYIFVLVHIKGRNDALRPLIPPVTVITSSNNKKYNKIVFVNATTKLLVFLRCDAAHCTFSAVANVPFVVCLLLGCQAAKTIKNWSNNFFSKQNI